MLHTNLKIPHVVGIPGVVPSFFAHLSLLSPLCLASSYFWNLITARKIPTLIQGQTLLIKCLGPSFWERKCQSWAVNTWDGMAHITHIGTVVRLTAEQNTGHRPQLWAQNKNPSTITASIVNCTKSHWYLSLHPEILLLLLWGITTTWVNPFCSGFVTAYPHLHPWYRLSFQQLSLILRFQSQLL